MPHHRVFRVFLLLLLAVHCLSGMPAGESQPAPVVLLSLDGFRWDYCDKFPRETPRLRQLKESGASVRGLIPVFPSNTFPNHYTIVTGLRPGRHGMVNNRFFDPKTGRMFSYNNPACCRDGRWWGGEPVWVTAGRQGKVSACSFWPGSEAEIGGLRPGFWKPFDYSIPFEGRLDELFGWLGQPVGKRPAVAVFYFEETNTEGHRWGPDSPELAEAISLLDARVGALVDRAESQGLPLNLVIVSDHGMTALSGGHVLVFEDYLDLDTVQIDFDGPVAGLRPLDGNVAGLMEKLEKLPAQARAYRREDLPQHLGVGDNPRYPPVWILPEIGWHIVRRAGYNSKRDSYMRGEHGYDPQHQDMQGILIVHGPAFRADGTVAPPAENIHIYNLLCSAAGLKPACNDGDDRLVRQLMR